MPSHLISQRSLKPLSSMQFKGHNHTLLIISLMATFGLMHVSQAASGDIYITQNKVKVETIAPLVDSPQNVTSSPARVSATDILETAYQNTIVSRTDLPTSNSAMASDVSGTVSYQAPPTLSIFDTSLPHSYLDNSADKEATTSGALPFSQMPLETVTDPATGVIIDSTYRISVPERLSLDQAQMVLTQVSPKLAGHQAAIESNRLRAQATKSLNQPWLFLRAGATHYDVESDIDLSEVKAEINDTVNQVIANGTSNLPIDPNIVPTIPPFISSRIPDTYDVKLADTTVSGGLAALWPVYTAGRTQATSSLADARTDESRADALMDDDELRTTLVKRYFNTQLAIIAAYLRDDALNTIQETDHMAQRYLEEGFISQVDRLEAKTALAEAQSEAIRAHNTANLAMTALQSLLRTPYTVKPTTPLFVSSTPLPPLSYFQQLAIEHQPALKKVDAKYAQAESLSQFSSNKYKPNVALYGYYDLSSKSNWIAGVSASWKLWGGLDSSSLQQSAKASMRQAQLAKIDVSDNILLLVESNWQAVENARLQYLSLNSNVLLTEELLRFKQRGLQEGLNTAVDVAQAQTKYLQARTEHTSAANDYVQALASLMQSVGTPEAFNDYMIAADIKLPVLF